MEQNNNNPLEIKVPTKIIERLSRIENEVEKIRREAEHHIPPFNTGISFEVTSSVPQDLLTEEERSAFLNFILKYRSIPDYKEPQLLTDGKRFILADVDLIRHMLNELRPILFNQKDPIFYQQLHKIVRLMLTRNANEGTKISVWSADGNKQSDLTKAFSRYLDGRSKAISVCLKNLELDYLYNGILQHADRKFSKRYERDVNSGELDYLFVKHALIISYIKWLLNMHHEVASIFWVRGYPRRGSLG